MTLMYQGHVKSKNSRSDKKLLPKAKIQGQNFFGHNCFSFFINVNIFRAGCFVIRAVTTKQSTYSIYSCHV